MSESVYRDRAREDVGMEVYLDSNPENFVPELALKAERVLDERWNGWLRPIATARAFGRFLDGWRRNDPNGVWGYVTEVGDVLLYRDSDASEGDDPGHIPLRRHQRRRRGAL